MNMNITDIDFGPFEFNGMKQLLESEFSRSNPYTQLVPVEEGDVVVDIGASVGIFTYFIIDRNPKHCFIVEPSSTMMKSAMNNLMGKQVSFHKLAISENINSNDGWDDVLGCRGVSFRELLQELNLQRIDFLKFDCEGGEYLIFTDDNIGWIQNNVSKMSGEFHLKTPELKLKFKEFCEKYLRLFPNFSVKSIDGVDILWSLFDGHGNVRQSFLDYYFEVIIHIDNRKI